MHMVVSWEITLPSGEERSRLEESINRCLKGFSWVRPLTGLRIVQLEDETDRDLIRADLIEVCKANKGKVNIIISPVMVGGRYAGWLPKDLWPKIIKRTD